MARHTTYEGPRGKIVITSILLLVLTGSAYLCWKRTWRSDGFLLTFTETNRSTVALVVQLFAGIASVTTLFALRSAISYAQRLDLVRKWTSIQGAAYWTAISSGTTDNELPSWHIFFTYLGAIAGVGLTALWAAALTPVITTQQCTLQTVGAVFSPATNGTWASQFHFTHEQVHNEFENCNAVWRDENLFTNCPVPHLNGFLLRAAEASTTTEQRPMSKFDNSGYTHIGRSYGVGYGVGMAAGMRTPDLDALGTESFSFVERGYQTNIDCIKNTSSALYFNTLSNGSGAEVPALYQVYGYLPNSFPRSDPEKYPVTTWHNPYDNMAAWAALHNPYDGTNFIAIAAGNGTYRSFNQTQCTIRFTPSLFETAVNVSSKTFIVTPKNDTGTVEDPEPSGNHTAAVVMSMSLLSRMTSGLYVSEVGEVMLSGLEALIQYTQAEGPTEELVIMSTERFLSSMADNILSAYALSQITMADDTYTIEIPNGVCKAVRHGADIYLWVVLILNAAIVIYVLVNYLRNDCWKSVPSCDPRRLAAVIIAASHGLAARGDHVREADEGPKTVDRVRLTLLNPEDRSEQSSWRFEVLAAPEEQGFLMVRPDEHI